MTDPFDYAIARPAVDGPGSRGPAEVTESALRDPLPARLCSGDE